MTKLLSGSRRGVQGFGEGTISEPGNQQPSPDMVNEADQEGEGQNLEDRHAV